MHHTTIIHTSIVDASPMACFWVISTGYEQRGRNISDVSFVIGGYFRTFLVDVSREFLSPGAPNFPFSSSERQNDRFCGIESLSMGDSFLFFSCLLLLCDLLATLTLDTLLQAFAAIHKS
jgi:hypothetical protein